MYIMLSFTSLHFAISFLGFAFPLSIPNTFNEYSLSCNISSNSVSYLFAHVKTSSYILSLVYLDITFLETSKSFIKSKTAPLTLIFPSSNLNSEISLSGFAFLHPSKFEFAIFNKYSQTACEGIPSS